MDTITGHIERITFQNADNGWTVARLQEPDKNDLVNVAFVKFVRGRLFKAFYLLM